METYRATLEVEAQLLDLKMNTILKYCPYCLADAEPGQSVTMVYVNAKPRVMHTDCVRRAGIHGNEVGRI